MVGKNNKFLKEDKNNQKFLRFSLRKLSIGVVSVAIAAGFYIGGSQSVMADTVSTASVVSQSTSNATSAGDTDKNVASMQSSSASSASSASVDSSAVASAADSAATEAVKSAAPAASSTAEQPKTAALNVTEAKPAAASNAASLLDNKAQSNAASDATAKTAEDKLENELLKNIKISDPTDQNFVRYQGYVDDYMSNNYGEEKSSQYVFSVIRDVQTNDDFIWTIDRATGNKVSVYLAKYYGRDYYGRDYEKIADYAQLPSDGGNFYFKSNEAIVLNYTPKTESESGSINVADEDGNYLEYIYGLGTPQHSLGGSAAELLPEKGQPIIKFLYKDPNNGGKLVNLRKPIYCKEGLTGQTFVLDTSNYANDISDYTSQDRAFDGFTLVSNNKDDKTFQGTFTQFDQGKTYVKYYTSDDSEVVYYQIDASGTMKVDYYKGGQLIGSIDRLDAGTYQTITDDTTGGTMTVRNPFVGGSYSYEFTYDPNSQKGKIIYQDTDNNNVEVDHTDLTGKTTQHVTVNPQVPDGYEIVPGQSIPKTQTATSNGIPDVIVKVKHHKITVTPGQEQKPGKKIPGNTNKKPGDGTPNTDVGYETLHKTMTRTINVTDQHGYTTTTKLTLHYERTATIDDVTGDVTYSNWTVADGSKASFAKFNIPSVPGYTSEIKTGSADELEALTPSQDQITNWTDQTIDIDYTANDQSMTIDYVDKDGNPVDGGHFVVSGKTDQAVNTNAKIPAGWVLVKGQSDAPATITFTGTPQKNLKITVEHGTTHVSHDNPVKPGAKTPSGKDINGAHKSDLNQTITRTITIHEPGKTANTITQTAKIYRDATVDNVTGEVTYGSWSTDATNWTEVDAPVHAGYTASQAKVDAVTVANGQKNVKIDITYAANKQTGHITYVDENGKPVGSTPLTGKTGETVAIKPAAPAGWELVPGQKYPATVTAKADGIPGVTLTVRHHMITVIPNDVPNPGDNKPGNTNKKPGDGTPNKTISHEDLNKTITRSFTVIQPDGTSTTKKQNLSFQRIATIDDVTGDVTYSDWGTEGVAFTAETVPTFDGYTSHVTAGNYGAYTPTQDQINNWTDPNITVTYTANDQTGEITYVDRQGNTIGTTPLTGKTGESVTINPVVPAGWKIVDGQLIPSSVTATANGIAGPSILVEHNMITVKPGDEPNPGDKKPANPNKKPGDGTPNKDISYEDLHKSTTRTITIHDPHNGDSVDRETINFNRIATIDDVTGEVTYGNWTVAPDSTQDRFNNVTYPVIPGYTMTATPGDHSAKILNQNDINNWVDPQIDVSYAAQDQSGKISYVGPDGQEVAHTNLTGKTDATIDVKDKVNVPTNWKIVPGQTIPDSVKAGTNGIPTVTINIEHDTITVTPNDPKTPADKLPDGTNYPNGVSQNDLNKTVTRTINITKPGEATATTKQTTSFNRSATVDLVNHKVTYTDWAQNGNNGWVAVDVPAVDGYTPSVANIGEVDVTPDTKDATIDVTYTANAQSQVVNYVDNSGKVIKTDTLNGKTGESVNVNVNVPDHYELVAGQNIPASVTLKTNNPAINIKVTPKLDDITEPSQLTKSISRTVTINVPGQTPIVENQTAAFTRTGKHNEVTGEDTYTDWKLDHNGLTAVNVPTVDGYTPSQTTVSGIDNPGVNDQLQNVTVNYTADAQKQVINYVDDQGNLIAKGEVDGVTDQTVTITPKTPEHYTIVPGQNIPANVTLTTNNKPITVKVTPKLDPITDPALLNKTITRTIAINKPNTAAQIIKQDAKFTRTGNTNEVTGEQTFSDWDLASNNWTEVDAPAVPGYTPDKSKIDAVNVTPDMTNTTATINYLTNAQTGKISYVDGNGNEVSHTDLAGKTGDTININPQVPVDWKIVEGQNIPKTVVAGPDGIPTVTVKIEHDTIMVTPDQPKNPSDKLPDGNNYPSGVSENDLNQTISRTITINVPNKPAQVINQKAAFTRNATIDLVNREITYGDWELKDSNLNKVDAPAVDGYTPSQASVDAINNPTVDTKLNNVTINYTANKQSQVINYVNDSGKVVKSDIVNGKTGDNVKINVNVPDHYVLVPGQEIPSDVTLTTKNTPIIVKVTPKMDPVTDPAKLNKSITRTINIKNPDGKTTTVKQVATFTRTGETNEVTGKTTYTDWKIDSNGWTKYTVPAIKGYTPSAKDVPAVNVTPDTKNAEVTITYTAKKGTVLIKYVDRNGKEIGRQEINGHVGETVKVTPQIPDDWVPVHPDTVPTEVQIKEENGQIIIVVIRHAEKDPVQTKNVTRTIIVTTPDGQTKTIKQVATISRHGELDLVTGQVTWQPWTTVQWDEFKPAAIAGYTPSLAEVPAVTVNGETADQTVKITYTAVAAPAQSDHQAPAASNTSDNRAMDQEAGNDAQSAAATTVSQQTASTHQAESTANSNRLPQTGNSHDASALASLGLASLLGMFGLGGKRRKRD